MRARRRAARAHTLNSFRGPNLVELGARRPGDKTVKFQLAGRAARARICCRRRFNSSRSTVGRPAASESRGRGRAGARVCVCARRRGLFLGPGRRAEFICAALPGGTALGAGPVARAHHRPTGRPLAAGPGKSCAERRATGAGRATLLGRARPTSSPGAANKSTRPGRLASRQSPGARRQSPVASRPVAQSPSRANFGPEPAARALMERRARWTVRLAGRACARAPPPWARRTDWAQSGAPPAGATSWAGRGASAPAQWPLVGRAQCHRAPVV